MTIRVNRSNIIRLFTGKSGFFFSFSVHLNNTVCFSVMTKFIWHDSPRLAIASYFQCASYSMFEC